VELNTSSVISLEVSIPPLAEQHRIVAKVDELMLLCDQLEQQTEQSLSAHQTLVEVLLTALTKSDSAVPVKESFQTNWQRIADHFDVLFTTEASIEQLKQTILQLAVLGKLVPQNPNDEPASVLLEKIAKEKARLIADKNLTNKRQKQKPLPEITDEEKMFELPSGWECIRLGYCFNSIASGGTPSKREPTYWNGGIPWASVKDLGDKRYLSETQDHISEKGLIAGSKLANTDDILICTRMGLGKICIVKTPMAYNQDLKAVSLTSHVNVEFFLNTYATIKIEGTGTTVAGIKQEELLNYIIGLPPLPEQHRIVAKVDELMTLCDQLKAQLSNAQTTQLHLADAVVKFGLK